MTYAEKLLDPRWQKKRLEILDRDHFTCQLCDDTTTTLHIHHLKYNPNRDPWDIANEFLITYCKHCHLVIERKVRAEYPLLKVIKLHATESLFILALIYYSIQSVEIFYFSDEEIVEAQIIPFDFIEQINNYLKNQPFYGHPVS